MERYRQWQESLRKTVTNGMASKPVELTKWWNEIEGAFERRAALTLDHALTVDAVGRVVGPVQPEDVVDHRDDLRRGVVLVVEGDGPEQRRDRQVGRPVVPVPQRPLAVPEGAAEEVDAPPQRRGDVGQGLLEHPQLGFRVRVELVQRKEEVERVLARVVDELQQREDLQQEWEWSEKYATQGEILTYAEHVVERFGLRDGMTFNSRVLATHYSSEEERWQVQLDSGEKIQARFVVMATGCLSKPNYPNIDGMNEASVPVYHTANWPHDGVDFTNMRVGVIGTGSSAIQSTPIIAEQAGADGSPSAVAAVCAFSGVLFSTPCRPCRDGDGPASHAAACCASGVVTEWTIEGVHHVRKVFMIVLKYMPTRMALGIGF